MGRHGRHVRRLAIAAALLLTSLVGASFVSAADDQPAAPAAAANTSLTVGRGSVRELSLGDEAARDIDVSFRLSADRAATGAGQTVSVVARRTTNAEYRVRVRLTSTNRVQLSVVRRVNGNARRVGSTVDAGFARDANAAIYVRVSVSRTSPTIVAAKAWPANAAEPSRWALRARDWSTTRASAGTGALRFSVPRTATNAPITYSYDTLMVTTLDQQRTADTTPAPTPTSTATPARTQPPTPTPAPTTTPGPTSTPATPAPITVPANAVFVSPNGSDSADGSLASPWRTLQRAADAASAGVSVVIRDGTYGGFESRRSGSAGSPITFMAYPGESVVIDGRNSVDYTVRLSGVQFVRIVGLTVQGGFAERQQGGGLLIGGSSQVEVRDSTFRSNRAFGIRSYNSTHVLIEGNDIYGNAVGIQVGGAGEGTVIRDNRIHDNDQMMVNTADVRGDDVGGEGVALVRSTGNVVVTDNRIWGNRAASYDYGYDGGAFSIYAAYNWTIRDNVTWDNRNVLETGTDAAKTACDNNRFVRNLNYAATSVDVTVGMVLRCASNTTVANNTFEGMQSFVFDISHMRASWGGSIEGLRIVNNVISAASGKIYGIESTLPASVVIDNNVLQNRGTGYLATYLGTGTKSLATFAEWTGQELHGTVADPLFRDPDAHDYRLRTESVAVDRGWRVAGVTDSYMGAAPDLGFSETR
jgi:parallel beta-helix repeat protein